MKRFVIEGTYYKNNVFPSLNNYINALQRSPFIGNRMKQEYEDITSLMIRTQLKDWQAQYPVVIHYVFTERDKGKKRDRMNVFAFADKVVEDALVKCGTLKDDSPEYVLNATHEFQYGTPKIEISLEEIKENP